MRFCSFTVVLVFGRFRGVLIKLKAALMWVMISDCGYDLSFGCE